VGLGGAVFLGLGSIVGTGLFVSLGVAAGVAGAGILLALPVAGLLALVNGLSSAQLAAAHPVSGGTYAYGIRFLNPLLGFIAGWMFLLAKGASAASAALGLGGYLLQGLALDGGGWTRVGLGVALILVWTVWISGGVGRAQGLNGLLVGITLLVLGGFLGLGLPIALPALLASGPPLPPSARDFFHATALLFVAFTGYGRIATLGEEVLDPARTIPRAIWITLSVALLLYLGVAATALGVLGTGEFVRQTEETAAPLSAVAAVLAGTPLAVGVSLAAVTALGSVLLNLILGLSRVVLAMGRTGDLPGVLAHVDPQSGSPRGAVFAAGLLVAGLVAVGDLRMTWSFSAFAVLIYYGLTHLAALRIPPRDRRYPPVIAVLGLIACLFLAFQVAPQTWAVGALFLIFGLTLRALWRKGSGAGPNLKSPSTDFGEPTR
jgi:basic amino acid/polyamine antiporter, APA family